MAVTCQFTGIEAPLGSHQETKRKLSLAKFTETGVMLKDLNYYSTFERWDKGYRTTSSTLSIDPPREDGLMQSWVCQGSGRMCRAVGLGEDGGQEGISECHISYLSGRTLRACPWTVADTPLATPYTQLPSVSHLLWREGGSETSPRTQICWTHALY